MSFGEVIKNNPPIHPHGESDYQISSSGCLLRLQQMARRSQEKHGKTPNTRRRRLMILHFQSASLASSDCCRRFIDGDCVFSRGLILPVASAIVPGDFPSDERLCIKVRSSGPSDRLPFIRAAPSSSVCIASQQGGTSLSWPLPMDPVWSNTPV